MLVLSRREDERILIGDNVVITVVRIANGKVRLGIDAPGDVRILRQELADADDKSQRGNPASSENLRHGGGD